MAQTSEHRACEIRRAKTSFLLALEMGRGNDAISVLPDRVQTAVKKISDSPRQLSNDDHVAGALAECGERASSFWIWLTEIRIAANHRRAA